VILVAEEEILSLPNCTIIELSTVRQTLSAVWMEEQVFKRFPNHFCHNRLFLNSIDFIVYAASPNGDIPTLLFQRIYSISSRDILYILEDILYSTWSIIVSAGYADFTVPYTIII